LPEPGRKRSLSFSVGKETEGDTRSPSCNQQRKKGEKKEGGFANGRVTNLLA